MRKSSTSSTLTVFFDGQFWVGVAEHVEDGRLSAYRHVFGAEPSNEEVHAWVLAHWDRLLWSLSVSAEKGKLARNPKRRAREAARDTRRSTGAGTAAQQALSAEREARAQNSAQARSARRYEEAAARFKRRTEKRRRTRRGH